MNDGAPHVGHRAAIEAEAFGGLAEVAANDVGELFDVDLVVGVEGVEIVDGDHAGSHVEAMVAGVVVRGADVGGGLVVAAEDLVVEDGVFVADRQVREEAQGLVVADGEGDALADVGLIELGGPPAVVGLHEDVGCVVEKAGEDDFFGLTGGEGFVGALEDMGGRGEAEAEEIDECGASGQGREAENVIGFALDAVAEGGLRADGKEGADAFAEGAGLDFGFDLSDGGGVRRDAETAGHGGIHEAGEVLFEGLGFGFGIHAVEAGGAAESGDDLGGVEVHGR